MYFVILCRFLQNPRSLSSERVMHNYRLELSLHWFGYYSFRLQVVIQCRKFEWNGKNLDFLCNFPTQAHWSNLRSQTRQNLTPLDQSYHWTHVFGQTLELDIIFSSSFGALKNIQNCLSVVSLYAIRPLV